MRVHRGCQGLFVRQGKLGLGPFKDHLEPHLPGHLTGGCKHFLVHFFRPLSAFCAGHLVVKLFGRLQLGLFHEHASKVGEMVLAAGTHGLEAGLVGLQFLSLFLKLRTPAILLCLHFFEMLGILLTQAQDLHHTHDTYLVPGCHRVLLRGALVAHR